MHTTKDQIQEWLKKLERESWQLELLVSAFTIFLLIQAIGAFSDMLEHVQYEYNLNDSLLSFIFVFFAMLGLSIRALSIFLILHLLLRGFWIGTIGLRSVQSNIHFDRLNYSDFFTEKLRKKVTSLDDLVVRLDQICSLMFSFAFLVISIFIAFGMYLLFLGISAVLLGSLTELLTGWMATVAKVVAVVFVFTYLLSGLIYLIDYFSLGFFKKYRVISKIYYPFYRFYSVITLSAISKSIYYYLISKFSKKRIRIVYGIAIGFIILFSLVEFDQYQFYPQGGVELTVNSNNYDNLRKQEDHVDDVSIQSNIISGNFLQLYLRYDPKHNDKIRNNCPDFAPEKEDGLNWSLKIKTNDGGFQITDRNFEDDRSELLSCLSSLYQIKVNDSIYTDLEYFYYTHPTKKQKGILSMINTEGFIMGKNILEVNRQFKDDEGEEQIEKVAFIPFWYQ
ncbi:MAG: hypothetical protein NXI20_23545 [bacterium]|nr:hypothetical protein [bacterium]